MRLILIVLSILVSSTDIEAQNFVNQKNIWRVLENQTNANGNNNFGANRYRFDDQLIEFNGEKYFELMRIDGGYGLLKTEQFYREEGGRVYFSWYNQQESLLYDFNLDIGDSYISGRRNVTKEITIVGTGLVHLNSGEIRKFWRVSIEGTSRETTIVEGVGSLYSPLLPFSEIRGFGSNLSCYSHIIQGEEIVQLETEEGCDYMSPVSTITSYSSKFRIYPTFTQSELFLESEIELQGVSLIIYDLSGQKVLEITDLRSHQISIAELINGMYFLHLQKDGKLLKTEKIVKQ